MSNKTWRLVAFVYGLAWFLIIAIERRGLATLSRHESMNAFELLLTVPFFWGYVIYALQKRYIHGYSGWRLTIVERDECPVRYWLGVAFYFLYGVFLIALAVKQA